MLSGRMAGRAAMAASPALAAAVVEWQTIRRISAAMVEMVLGVWWSYTRSKRRETSMPWESDKQSRWGNSPSGHKALGDAGVEEFNRASKGMDLPEAAGKQKTRTPPRRKKKAGPMTSAMMGGRY